MGVDNKFEFDSPFEVGKPANFKNFVGRNEAIDKILRYVNRACKGEVQHFFLTGERGIGKTSLAMHVMDLIEKNWGMTGVYLSNKKNNSLESLLDSIVSEILNIMPKESIRSKFKNIFGNIESLKIKDATITFKSQKEESKSLVMNFPYYMQDLINEINKNNGIFLVIDDINGLTDSKNFVDWYKGFADTVAVNKNLNLNLYILFVGYPIKFNNLVELEPLFGRIFNQYDLNNLNDYEVKDFFINTFNNVGINCYDEALNTLVYFSEGLPLLMQQIGESCFWLSENNEINKNIALSGVFDAIDEIGHKPMRHIIDLVSKLGYGSILLKLGDNNLFSFNKDDLLNKLTDYEINILDNFLNDMIKLNILYVVGFEERKVYTFVNSLYFIYFKIKAYELNNNFII